MGLAQQTIRAKGYLELTSFERIEREVTMEGPARGCLAGLISWKLGGGIFSTIIIFIIVFWLLGHIHC